MKPKTHRRKQYLVNKEIQLSFSWLLIVSVGSVIFVFGLALWYLNRMHMGVIYKLVGEDALPMSYVQSTDMIFLLGIPAAILLVSGLLLVLGIYSSHRVAGPMFRITRHMNDLGVNGQVDTVQIRKHDQLREMAEAFNHMVHTLKDRMYQDMRLIDQFRIKISSLYDCLKGDSLDVRQLSDQVKEIDRLANDLRNRKNV